MLAVDADTKTITGYYYSSTGRGRFTCGFFIRGTLGREPPYEIQTWWPGDKEIIGGVIDEFEDSEIAITLKEEHGGCWNVRHFIESETNTSFSLDKKEDWKTIRVISTPKAYFHSSPDKSTRQKAYCVQQDAIAVTDTAPDWVYAEYGKTRGWISVSDLFADVPPIQQ